MRATPHLPARVVWEEGMYLAPHHFQAQRRHFDEAVALSVGALFAFPYGVAGVELDEEALRNGTLALRHARGVLPDGTPFRVPDADPAPAPGALAERFSPAKDGHVVHLALAPWRGDEPNVAGLPEAPDAAHAPFAAGAPADADARFVAVPHEVVDEVTGLDRATLYFAAKRLRLLLDDEVAAADVTMPVARVVRDGAGRFQADAAYVPPCLRLGASARLVGLLQRVLGMLEAKAATLSAGAGAGGPSAYAGNEVATRWLLHAVRSAEGPLRHLLATRAAHPERLWVELSRLAGALCTFSLTAQARDLPRYDHDDLTGCFAALERHLREHLDVVVAARALVQPLARASEVLWTATVPDPRCFEPGARWFLAARSAAGPVETATRVPQFAKACASKYVLELVRRAYPGMPLEYLPAPPPGIAPRADAAYFEMQLAGPCGQGLRDTREFGVYVPDAIPDPQLELVVLLPG
ncbi:type VI secretion system baseplate subunit TssK [Roseisolibacter sp. H3M3-2]|uniref:type VI secretion system baseplate subunit TssK n=1 Tax=Roseisolibacter sp. H3M3-2 TaxID=3031323 RepID=UPI0023DC7730|nr:type VI secretion system baseplate subunit TssK [Roseisolibacter sp. H3M3-2]MDF1505623.1 type VI secretion system baseplate subunit TssK [Roseisolibacter sp. H3M3-2]